MLTLRTVTIAALMVLFFAPEAVVHPSFQMSFAATLALIAGYERGIPWARAGADTSLGARAALWGVCEILSLIVASLLAGLATTPYAAFHFHRMAPYGVLANLLAMPIVSALGDADGHTRRCHHSVRLRRPVLAANGLRHRVDGLVALWVSSLPGAFGRVSSFGTGPLLVATLGLLLICLLKTPLRWSGLLFGALAAVLALRTPLPDILVAADRAHLRRARRKRQTFLPSLWQRRLRHARMARGRRRRPGGNRSQVGAGDCLRSDGLRWQAV